MNRDYWYHRFEQRLPYFLMILCFCATRARFLFSSQEQVLPQGTQLTGLKVTFENDTTIQHRLSAEESLVASGACECLEKA